MSHDDFHLILLNIIFLLATTIKDKKSENAENCEI